VAAHLSPVVDVVVGWARDGKAGDFLLRTAVAISFLHALVHASREKGDFPRNCRCRWPRGFYSPDAKELAYVPLNHAFEIWKRYRGGPHCRFGLPAGGCPVGKIRRDNSNDFNPMWWINDVFFLSDRDGPVILVQLRHSFEKRHSALKNDDSTLVGERRTGRDRY